jgi:hypothetical protein
MEKLKDRINKSFESLFDNKQHIFFKDINEVNKLSKEYILNMKKYINHKINFDPNISVPESQIYNPEYKILTKNKINELAHEMNHVLNWDKILKIVSFMSQHVLESNISSEQKLYKLIKTEDTLNIMIIGSGPIGLFIACYLKLYYSSSMDKKKKVNVVVYDNRIEKPGFRKPYTRQRPFYTSSHYLNLIIPKIYCWNNSDSNSLYVNIFMLEYILYTTAISYYNIPIIYNDYTWDQYMDIMKKGNFKVVFDCSGGRLKHNLFKNLNKSWLDKFKTKDVKLNKMLIIDTKSNLVKLDNIKSKQFKKNYYYGSVSIFKDNMNFVVKYDIDIVNNYDLLYLNNIKNKIFKYNDILHIIKGISDSTSRHFLYSIISTKKSIFYDNQFSIDVFSIWMRHAIKISDIINVGNHKALYIGAGDTIFHSHFITGAGLNRTLDFAVKCCNQLDYLYE